MGKEKNMKKQKVALLVAATSLLTIGVVGLAAMNRKSNISSLSTFADNARSFTLDLSTAHTFENDIAYENAINENAGNYEVSFKLTRADDDNMGIYSEKTRFLVGDSVENVEELSGITGITVSGGNGYYQFFAGYTKDAMYDLMEFFDVESNGGSRIFSGLPMFNYFRLVGNKTSQYPADIASITFTYSHEGTNTCSYGEASDITDFTVQKGTFLKSTHTLIVGGENGESLTLDGTSFSFIGFDYDVDDKNGLVAYADGDGHVIGVKFDNNGHAHVKHYEKYGALNGDYTVPQEATALTVLVGGNPVKETTPADRLIVKPNNSLTFSASTDRYPTETVNAVLNDETYVAPTGDTFAGTYTFTSYIVAEDLMSMNCLIVNITSLVISKVNDDYFITYSDAKGAQSDIDYVGYSLNDAPIEIDGNGDLAIELANAADDGVDIVLSISEDHIVSISAIEENYDYYCESGVQAEFAPAGGNPGFPACGTLSDMVFTAATAGAEANIVFTAAESGLTKTVYIKVSIPATVSLNKNATTLEVGETEQLVATVNNDATFKELAWTTSNNKVVTVSESGLLTATGAGSATVTVTTVDGNKAQISVTVTAPAPSYNGTYVCPDLGGEIIATLVINGNTATMTLDYYDDLTVINLSLEIVNNKMVFTATDSEFEGITFYDGAMQNDGIHYLTIGDPTGILANLGLYMLEDGLYATFLKQ